MDRKYFFEKFSSDKILHLEEYAKSNINSTVPFTDLMNVDQIMENCTKTFNGYVEYIQHNKDDIAIDDIKKKMEVYINDAMKSKTDVRTKRLVDYMENLFLSFKDMDRLISKTKDNLFSIEAPSEYINAFIELSESAVKQFYEQSDRSFTRLLLLTNNVPNQIMIDEKSEEIVDGYLV